jgi:hypothetical protein
MSRRRGSLPAISRLQQSMRCFFPWRPYSWSGQDSFNSYPLGRTAQAGAIPPLGETKLRTTDTTRERIKAMDVIIG